MIIPCPAMFDLSENEGAVLLTCSLPIDHGGLHCEESKGDEPLLWQPSSEEET